MTYLWARSWYSVDDDVTEVVFNTLDTSPHVKAWIDLYQNEKPFHLVRTGREGPETLLHFLEFALIQMAGRYGFLYTSTSPIVLEVDGQRMRLRDVEALVFPWDDRIWVASTLVFPMFENKTMRA